MSGLTTIQVQVRSVEAEAATLEVAMAGILEAVETLEVEAEILEAEMTLEAVETSEVEVVETFSSVSA